MKFSKKLIVFQLELSFNLSDQSILNENDRMESSIQNNEVGNIFFLITLNTLNFLLQALSDYEIGNHFMAENESQRKSPSLYEDITVNVFYIFCNKIIKNSMIGYGI